MTAAHGSRHGSLRGLLIGIILFVALSCAGQTILTQTPPNFPFNLRANQIAVLSNGNYIQHWSGNWWHVKASFDAPDFNTYQISAKRITLPELYERLGRAKQGAEYRIEQDSVLISSIDGFLQMLPDTTGGG